MHVYNSSHLYWEQVQTGEHTPHSSSSIRLGLLHLSGALIRSLCFLSFAYANVVVSGILRVDWSNSRPPVPSLCTQTQPSSQAVTTAG